MKRRFTIQELADILGCSRVAISKKIKVVDGETGTKRYKNVYEVVSDSGVMQILLTDEELEKEKRLSKGFNNVSSSGYDTHKNEDIIDIEPMEQQKHNDKLLEFTERYINDFKTLQETMYNELRNRDNQINLLTTSEKTKEKEYLQALAENKTLKERNRVITLCLIGLVTLLIVIITFSVTFAIVTKSVSNVNKEVSTTVENVSNPEQAQKKEVKPVKAQPQNRIIKK